MLDKYGLYVPFDADFSRASVEGGNWEHVARIMEAYYGAVAVVARVGLYGSGSRTAGVKGEVAGVDGYECVGQFCGRGTLELGSNVVRGFDGIGGRSVVHETEVDKNARVASSECGELCGKESGISGASNLESRGRVEVGCRGKWYKKNKARKEKLKVRDEGKSFGSLGVEESSRCETVYSSSASTLAEGKVKETLALRRIAENELATEKAKALVRSYRDSKKTEALAELSALRIVQRANDARAKSQESWKKCDESLGSLGSTGSAGEFHMKREVQKGKEFQVKYEYARKQCMLLMASATPDVLEECRKMPVPVSGLCSDQEFADEMLDFELRKDLEEMLY